MKDASRIQVEKITGLADEQYTCSVFSKRVTTIGESVGTLVGCVLAKNGSLSDLQTKLHGLFEIFAGKLEGANDSFGDRLLEALAAGKSVISEQSLDVSFAICFFYQSACYVVRLGNWVKVWTYGAGKSQELSFEYGSGPYAAGQIFVLGTEKFFSTFDTSTLLLGQELDLEEVMDGLATDISSDEKQCEIGVAFIKVGDDVEQKAEKAEDLSEEQRQELPVSEAISETVTVAPGVLERNKVDSEVFDTGEQIYPQDVNARKVEADVFPAPAQKKFGIGKIVGSFFGRIFAEIGKLRRGDVRAIFRLRRNLVVVAFLLLVILGGSIYFTINSQKQEAKLADFKRNLDSAKVEISEADGIISLNRDKAREKLVDASKNIVQALALFPKDADATRLKSEVEGKLKETENVAGLPFREVADIGENLVSITLGKNGLTAFSDSKIVEVSKDGKVGDKSESLSGTQAGFVLDNSGFVVANGKIAKIDLGTGKKEDIASIDSGRDLAVFLGNVYVLGNEQITKFVPIEKGYGDGQSYLEKKETFGDDSRFAIDGMIWVTLKNQILKYNRGKREDFSVQGLVISDVNFGEIYTNGDLDNIYVIDKLNGALLVIKKDGTYQKAYQSSEFKKNPSFVVDEAQGKVYIVQGSKIMEADLSK